MNGSWINLDNLNVYWSNTRSMARFGLMIYANGMWKDQEIINEAYLNEATNTSQDVNLAYGYLWWLNGKSSYHLPQSQFTFPGELIPNVFVNCTRYIIPTRSDFLACDDLAFLSP